ncbi:MAG: permease [Proteobacteria bacterium]|nr:permease [Pseudomonadota bacterium]
MQRLLSLDQSPPFSVPLRFFLSAPAFALLAALLLLWQGPQAFMSRWSPATLALTHLLTIGVLSMTMIGALLQILQVVAGVEIPQARQSAAAIHALLTVGCLLLACAFLESEPWLFRLALPCLLLGFGWLLIACAIGMWRNPTVSETLSAIRLSLIGLSIAILLGALAASVFAWSWELPLLPLPLLADLHAGWGLLAWVGLLVVGVAYQVVPMFQVTEIYPTSVTHKLAGSVFIALTLWTVATYLAPETPHWLEQLPALLLGVGYLTFAIVTLQLIRHRKRPRTDAATLFWYAALSSLSGAVLLWLLAQCMPALSASSAYPLLLGVLFIAGFACSVINGMLYKIVPFLVWYHLQHRITDRSQRAPNVRQVIDEQASLRQFGAHVVALLLLLGATWDAEMLARPAAVAFGISSAWLLRNLLQAMRTYRDFNKRMTLATA